MQNSMGSFNFAPAIKPPCGECTERFPACHDAAKCDKWAKYEAQKTEIKEAIEKDRLMNFYGLEVKYRPRAKRKFNAMVKGEIK